MALTFNLNDSFSGDEDAQRPSKKPRRSGPAKKRPRKNKTAKDQPKSKPKGVQTKIILGVDLGTTFSGFAYATNKGGSNDRIEVGTDYPNASDYGPKLEKMPSIIAYASENEKYWSKNDADGKDVFGYEVYPGMKTVAHFKLLLDDGADLTENDDPLLDSKYGDNLIVLPHDKTPEQVTVDFLKYMREVAYDSLNSALTNEVCNMTPIEVIATTPAKWEDIPLQKIKSAFKEAGIGARKMDCITLISEPQAAGIAVLKELTGSALDLIQTEDAIVIVDIGGGTIDAESMCVKEVMPLKLDAIGISKSFKSGATAIDRRFIRHMSEVFGTSYEKIPEEKRGPHSDFMNIFEKQKRAFKGSLNKPIRISFTQLHIQLKGHDVAPKLWDDEDGEVILHSEHMIEFFKHTVSKTCEAALDQVNKVKEKLGRPPKFIFLAGGLSGSKYLYDQVEKYCKESLDGIRLLCPANAWGAIARGAVAYGLNQNMILSHVARRNYYVVIRRAFREGTDPENRAVMCPLNGKRLDGKLTVLLRKGDVVKKYQKPHEGHVVADDLKLDAMRDDWTIYSSDSDELSTWYDDVGVKPIGSLKIDMTAVSMELVKKGYSNVNLDLATNPLPLPVKLELKGGHSAGVFCIRALSGRKCVGELTLSLSK